MHNVAAIENPMTMDQDKQDQQAGRSWEAYYESLKGREPSPLFTEVLAKFESWTPSSSQSRSSPGQRHAVDLGCGDGTETLALLVSGWSVLAIDSEPAAINYVRSKAAAEHQPNLETMLAGFEDLRLPETDLVYAGYSLPFCKPAAFNRLWDKITSSIRPGGRFAGQLFGLRDSWADKPEMTFHSAEQAAAVFAEGFEIESIEEKEEDSAAFSGLKHWHFFDIIARKLT